MKVQASITLAALAGISSAHTIFSQLETGGTTYPVSYGVRTPVYDGFIGNVASNDLACNGPSNGGGVAPLATPYVLNVTAGSTVEAIWRHTLTSTASDVIDPSHKGPVIAYLKKVTDATTDPGYGTGWFKISQTGFNNSTKLWGVDNLIAAGGVQSIPIPSCIANGQYLLRAEVIALHGAGSVGGAQFYTECAQINISGGTGAKTPATVSFPGAYSATDPGILISIYYPTVTNYIVPGPAVFSC